MQISKLCPRNNTLTYQFGIYCARFASVTIGPPHSEWGMGITRKFCLLGCWEACCYVEPPTLGNATLHAPPVW